VTFVIFSAIPKLSLGESFDRSEKGEKMNLAKFASFLFFVFLLAGCSLVPVQHPPGSTAYPAPQRQVTGSQRGQYVLEKAMEGLALGGALAGIYGAGGGLILGLITGLFTAEHHYAQVNSQIQSEQAKDRELEAKIEQEIQRQRELETQLAKSVENSTQQNQAEPPQSAQKPADPRTTAVAMKQDSSAVSSLSNKESPSNSPAKPFKNVEVRDINGDGVPDLWTYYNPAKPGEITRQEEATHSDGKVDAWSYFKDGKLVRREVDTKRKGTADTVYYYENDKIVREERDENGTGNVSFRAIYQNGRRVKVETDTKGGGKADHWIYYDTIKDGEIVLKEERDLDGDGTVDLWSYYENGRLVRRDLSAIGLELLSKQDRPPSPPADPENIARRRLVKTNRERN
jgi:antitoxin component YwqK of YwqJK toxin-antitoxin module